MMDYDLIYFNSTEDKKTITAFTLDIKIETISLYELVTQMILIFCLF